MITEGKTVDFNSFIPTMIELLSGENPTHKLVLRAKLAIIMSYSTVVIGIIVLLKMPYNIDKFTNCIWMTLINFSSGQLHLQSSKNQKCLSNLQVSFGVNF